MDRSQLLLFVASGISMLALLLVMGMFLLLSRHWFRAYLHGAPVMLTQILGMRLRGNPPALLVDAFIILCCAGDKVTIGDVENTYVVNRARILGPDDLVEQVRNRQAEVSAKA